MGMCPFNIRKLSPFDFSKYSLSILFRCICSSRVACCTKSLDCLAGCVAQEALGKANQW